MLGTIIQRLSQKQSGWVPYRDSKLTRYMQKALAGAAKITIVSTISPAAQCYDESMNTLSFALRAKRITQVVKKNELQGQIDPAIKKAYERKIHELQSRLKQLEAEHSFIGNNTQSDIEIVPGAEQNEATVLRTKVTYLDKELEKVTREKRELLDEVTRFKSQLMYQRSQTPKPIHDMSCEMESRLRDTIVEESLSSGSELLAEEVKLPELDSEVDRVKETVEEFEGKMRVPSASP